MRVTTGLVALAALCGAAHADEDPLGGIGLAELEERLDTKLPKSSKKYLKQAAPFLKMFTSKLSSEECKSNWGDLFDVIKIAAKKEDVDLTPRMFLAKFCDVGDECISEAIGAGIKYVEANSFAKGLADKFLEKNLPSMTLDDLAGGAPLLYMGVCASVNTDADLSELSGGAEEDEKEEL